MLATYKRDKCSLRHIVRGMILYVSKIRSLLSSIRVFSFRSPQLDSIDNTFDVTRTQIPHLRFVRDCYTHQIRNDRLEAPVLHDHIGEVPVVVYVQSAQVVLERFTRSRW